MYVVPMILCTSLVLLGLASTRRLARGPGRTTAGQRKAGLAFHLEELRERLAPPGPRSAKTGLNKFHNI